MRGISFYMKGIIPKKQMKNICSEEEVSISYETCFACCLLSREWTLTVQHILIINQKEKKKHGKGRLAKFLKLENIILNGTF